MTFLKVNCNSKAKLIEVKKMADYLNRERYIVKFSLEKPFFVTDAPEEEMILLKEKFSWLEGWKRIKID